MVIQSPQAAAPRTRFRSHARERHPARALRRRRDTFSKARTGADTTALQSADDNRARPPSAAANPAICHHPARNHAPTKSHVRDPADAVQLAEQRRNRLLYRYAIPLYRYAAAADDMDAALRLAWLLAERGDLDELRARTDAGDRAAAFRLADRLPLLASSAPLTICLGNPT